MKKIIILSLVAFTIGCNVGGSNIQKNKVVDDKEQLVNNCIVRSIRLSTNSRNARRLYFIVTLSDTNGRFLEYKTKEINLNIGDTVDIVAKGHLEVMKVKSRV
jgi:hypothetical protein